jgi:hypothetical protein
MIQREIKSRYDWSSLRYVHISHDMFAILIICAETKTEDFLAEKGYEVLQTLTWNTQKE